MRQKIKILEAKFAASSPNLAAAPIAKSREVVFLGRSNVGKSSLINALCSRKNLAKTSSSPGKTRLINFYDISFERDGTRSNIRFTDLPGFGYAKVSKQIHSEWEKNLSVFLKKRDSVKIFLRLIDSRHIGLQRDETLFEFVSGILKNDQKEFAVFTKADKLSRAEKDAILRKDNSAFLVSTHDRETIEKLLETIIEISFEGDRGTI